MSTQKPHSGGKFLPVAAVMAACLIIGFIMIFGKPG